MVSSSAGATTVPPSDEVNLLVFKGEDDLRPVLDALHLSLDAENVIHRESGEPAKCDGCESVITTENLGHILPGSQYFYCTDPGCVVKYFTERI